MQFKEYIINTAVLQQAIYGLGMLQLILRYNIDIGQPVYKRRRKNKRNISNIGKWEMLPMGWIINCHETCLLVVGVWDATESSIPV